MVIVYMRGPIILWDMSDCMRGNLYGPIKNVYLFDLIILWDKSDRMNGNYNLSI